MLIRVIILLFATSILSCSGNLSDIGKIKYYNNGSTSGSDNEPESIPPSTDGSTYSLQVIDGDFQISTPQKAFIKPIQVKLIKGSTLVSGATIEFIPDPFDQGQFNATGSLLTDENGEAVSGLYTPARKIS